MPAKKNTPTKKVAKKVAKKIAKKVAKKRPTNKANLTPKTSTSRSKKLPTTGQIEQAAYFNYLERIQNGISGSAAMDWAKAEQDLT